MTPHPNLIHFARMAQPSAAAMPPQGYAAPSMQQRAPMPAAARMASQGRGGDSMMAHLTPGEIAVPPEVQTPEVLAALNKAFAQAGANPTSFQAGNPDQKVNPETGAPEFGFFDIALPLALGVAGSMFLGPEVLAPFLVDAGVGGTTAGILGGALGGGLGSFAGNAITGKPLDQSLLSAAGGAAGSAAFGGLMSGLGSGAAPISSVWDKSGAALSPSAISGPIPQPTSGFSAADNFNAVAADGIRNPAGMETMPGGGLSGAGLPLTVSGAGVPDRNWFDSISDKIGNINPKQAIGSALGGQIGSALAESYFPPKTPAVDLGPHLGPVGPVGPAIGGGSPSSNGPIPYGAPRRPPLGYRPGLDPQFDYFPR